MGPDQTSYDLTAGTATVSTLGPTVADIEAAETPRWGPGYGRGGPYNSFVSAYDDYRREVNDRLEEQRRVGDLVAAMVLGVHHRFGLEA